MPRGGSPPQRYAGGPGTSACAPHTGGYCKARQRLPESLLERLLPLSGGRLQQQIPAAWHWHGRAVKLVDGSGVSMPDTPENQRAYPQTGGQAPGRGFPAARLTGENLLFHSLHTELEAGDGVLADR